MSAKAEQVDRVQQRQQARFERMGLDFRPMPDGRSLLVSLPILSGPFESLAGSFAPDRILFATVGADQIKCLRPRPVFGLPLLDIRRCADAAAIEASIRQAWRDRMRELRDTARTLQDLGMEVGTVEGGSVLSCPLSGESADHPVLIHRLDEAILPTIGPLTGRRMAGPEERVVDLSGRLDSASDLDLFLAGRMQEVGRAAAAREAASRSTPPPQRERLVVDPISSAAQTRIGHVPKVLLVGAQVIEDESLRRELKQAGYRIATARSETEALMRLAAMTPDLVISQYTLGRSDGATFIQAIRALPGVVQLPVVLLDDVHHPSRQDAARAVGAIGYVIHPIEANRFVARLRKVTSAPRDRRFTRYSGRLVARLEDHGSPCLATEIGRGGVFIATPEAAGTPDQTRCRVTLPELRRDLSFVGDVLYRSDEQGVTRQGIGVRITDISPEDEAALIAYVTLRARRA